MFNAALELAKKDLRIYFRDPVAWLLGFLLPIVLVTIFGFLMGAAWGGGGPAPRVTLYVVDEENSDKSTQFITALRDSDMLRVRPRLDEPAVTRDKAEQLIRDGEISHALIIEPGFSEGRETSGKLRLLRDPGRSMEDQIVRINLLQAMFRSGGGDWWIGSLRSVFGDAGVPVDQLDQFDSQARAMTGIINAFSFPLDSPDDRDANAADQPGHDEPSKDSTEAASTIASEKEQATDGNKSPSAVGGGDPMAMMSKMLPLATEDYSPPSRPKQATYQIAQAVAGMSVMMLMFGVTSCGRTLIQERQRGTMSRLLSIGVPRTSLLLGTALFTIVVGLLQMVVMMIYGELMFHVGIFNDLLTLGVLSLLWVLTSTSLGLLIAAGAKSEKQADMLATILIISMAALGGCWFPLQMLDLPLAFEVVTQSTPTYWAMTGFQSMLWNGSNLLNGRVLTAIGVQAIYAVLLSVSAVWLFRRNYLRG